MKKIWAFFLSMIIVLSVSISGVLAEVDFSNTLYCGNVKWHEDAKMRKNWDNGFERTYTVTLTSTSTKFTGISFNIPNNLNKVSLVFRPYFDDDRTTKICTTANFYGVIFTYYKKITGYYDANCFGIYSGPGPEFILKSSLSGPVEYVSYNGRWRA